MRPVGGSPSAAWAPLRSCKISARVGPKTVAHAGKTHRRCQSSPSSRSYSTTPQAADTVSQGKSERTGTVTPFDRHQISRVDCHQPCSHARTSFGPGWRVGLFDQFESTLHGGPAMLAERSPVLSFTPRLCPALKSSAGVSPFRR